MASTNVDVVIRLIDQLSAPARKVRREMGGLDRAGRDRVRDGRGRFVPRGGAEFAPGGRLNADQMDALNGRMAGATRGVGALDAALMGANRRLVALAAGVVRPTALAYGFQAAVRDAADFETSITNIQKKLGETDGAMKAIRQDVLDLATSGEVAVSIDEVAVAYERWAAAGITSRGELRELTILSAQATDSFDMTAEAVTNAAAGFEKSLGVSRDGMERFFDLINALGDSGIADEADIIHILDESGAILNNFGLANEEAAALASTLVNLKISPDVAASRINSVFSRLLAPGGLPDPAYAAFQELVGNIDEFTDKVQENAQEALNDLLENLLEIDDVAKRGTFVSEIFGRENTGFILTLLQGMEEYRKNLHLATKQEAKWRGSLDRTTAMKADDVNTQLQHLHNNWRRLKIEMGALTLPGVNASTIALTEWLRDFHEGSTGLNEVLRSTKAIMDGIASGAGFESTQAAISALGTAFSNLWDEMGGGEQTTGDLARKFQAAEAVSGQIAYNLGEIKDALEAIRGFAGWLGENTAGVREKIEGMFPETPPILKAIHDLFVLGSPLDLLAKLLLPESLTTPPSKDAKPQELPSQIGEKRFATPEGSEAGARPTKQVPVPPEDRSIHHHGPGVPSPVANPFQERFRTVPDISPLQGSINRLAAVLNAAPLMGSRVPTTFTLPGNIIPPEMLSPELTLETSQFRAAAEGAAALLAEMSRAGAASMTLDTSGYVGPAHTALGKRAELERPIRSTADVDISPALSKMAQLRAEAARTGAAVSASLRSGGGRAAYKSALDTQFAPAAGRTSA